MTLLIVKILKNAKSRLKITFLILDSIVTL